MDCPWCHNPVVHGGDFCSYQCNVQWTEWNKYQQGQGQGFGPPPPGPKPKPAPPPPQPLQPAFTPEELEYTAYMHALEGAPML